MRLTKKIVAFLVIVLITSTLIILIPKATEIKLDSKAEKVSRNYLSILSNSNGLNVHLDTLEKSTLPINLVPMGGVETLVRQLIKQLRTIPILEKFFILPIVFLFNTLFWIFRHFFWDPIITPFFLVSISIWSWLVNLVKVHVVSFPVELHFKGGSRKNVELFPNELTEGYRIYIGTLELPEQIYKDDSSSISAKFVHKAVLKASEDLPEHIEASSISTSAEIEANKIVEKVKLDNHSSYNLELGLSASGFSIAEDKKQVQTLESNDLYFYWNCHFSNSGSHEIRLLLKAISSKKEHVLRDIKHTVKVVVLGGMTQNQVSYLSTLGGVVTFIIAILAFLKK